MLDSITQNLDLLASVVYGRILRYEQGKEKMCLAARKTLANNLGISEKTVERRIKMLVDHKYIKDLTPDRRNRPHNYVTTGKAGIKMSAEAYDEVRQRVVVGTSESRSHPVRESVEERTKKHNNKQLTNTKEVFVAAAPQPEPVYVDDPFEEIKPKNNHKPLVGALSRVTGLDIKMHARRLGKSAKNLRVAGYTPEQVEDTFGEGGTWYSRDWRGKKGQKPTPELVVEQIKNLLESQREKYTTGEFSDFIEH